MKISDAAGGVKEKEVRLTREWVVEARVRKRRGKVGMRGVDAMREARIDRETRRAKVNEGEREKGR